MSLHHGLTDLRNNHFTDSYTLPWFPTSYQASLRFCLWAKLTSKNQLEGKLYGPTYKVCMVLLGFPPGMHNQKQ